MNIPTRMFLTLQIATLSENVEAGVTWAVVHCRGLLTEDVSLSLLV